MLLKPLFLEKILTLFSRVQSYELFVDCAIGVWLIIIKSCIVLAFSVIEIEIGGLLFPVIVVLLIFLRFLAFVN